MDENKLRLLCGLCGISLEYRDIWGNLHSVSIQTQLALVRAMGYKADTDEDISAAIRQLETREWLRPVEPAAVIKEGAAPEITVTLPAGMNSIQWAFTEEGGRETRGTFTCSEPNAFEKTEIDGKHYCRYSLTLDIAPPPGYHSFRIDGADKDASVKAAALVIVVPRKAYVPEALKDERRIWGISAQLYSVKSQADWGIGDFGDLKQLIGIWGGLGAGMVGVNPLHAMFPSRPDHYSPYSPSNRLFLNVLYIDVESVEDFQESEAAKQRYNSDEFQARLQRLREGELLDNFEVTGVKMEMFEIIFDNFRERHLDKKTKRAQEFLDYVEREGRELLLHCTYDALNEHFADEDPKADGWRDWPPEYQDPGSHEVEAFAKEYEGRILFYQYLQWLADDQLHGAGLRSLEMRLGVGLYEDLAVGSSLKGSEGWANQDTFARGVSIGSPPDDFNLKGQVWMLPPPVAWKMKEAGYRHFISLLRHNMLYSGAIRIDHIMALFRLFWVPDGKDPLEGAYVYYPSEDLMGILALESVRNRCVIIGEDLGTVPPEVPAAMKEYGIFSYRIFFFQQDEKGAYLPPNGYPSHTMVVASTHDLPTLAGYWQGRDLTIRKEYGAYPSEQVWQDQVLWRSRDRAAILVALEKEALLPEGVSSEDPATAPEMTEELINSIHKFLARTPSQILIAQVEDIIGWPEQVNLPGTGDARPNWRHRLPVTLEEMRESARVKRLAFSLRRQRGREQIEATVEELLRLLKPDIPRCTYRLQLNGGFTFRMAADLVPYLGELGVSHVYCSPYLRTREGSLHGYDIIDHNSLSPEIGSMLDYERFISVLKEYGMGQVMDLVPNHMAVMGSDNAWWLDVLENGQASAYANFFDIDWHPLNIDLRDKVHLPVLGDQYGNVLERGELKLVFDPDKGSFSVRYYEHAFPIDPMLYTMPLSHNIEELEEDLGPENPALLEFQSLVTAFGHLPSQHEKDPQKVAERSRDKEIYKKQLAAVYSSSRIISEFIDRVVAEFNGQPGQPESFNYLHSLLDAQAYRLAYWRVAADEINYRRFFDINDLAGLQMENLQVYEKTHQLIFRYIREGRITGLRIDHPDGLYDPLEYFQRLQRSITAIKLEGREPVLEEEVLERIKDVKPFYIVAEKILAGHEYLPESWPIHGSTGYDFSRWADGLFVDAENEARMTRIYSRFIGEAMDFEVMLYERKKLIMRVSLASELNVLANMLRRIANSDRHTRDFTINSLRDAIKEVVACFPVYRTYLNGGEATPEDRRHIDWAVNLARRRSKTADVSVFDFFRDVLLLERAEKRSAAFVKAAVRFAMKFQQYTSPVTAKGLEDTAFYIYNRLVSLNEVGGDPSRFGTSPQAFHHITQERTRRWPHSMLLTSSHDSKRSGDMRMRINVLSELPMEWRMHLARWTRTNKKNKRELDGRPVPSRNDEYLFYQTLVGSWPLAGDPEAFDMAGYASRIEAYMLKAAREAKVHMSWVAPNQGYEDALVDFIGQTLAGGTSGFFLNDFVPFVMEVSRYGLYNSLSQTLLKLTSPGVPDIYQGDEIFSFMLVDPDNRRHIDYAQRRLMLDSIKNLAGEGYPRSVRDLLHRMEDGMAKMFLIWKVLSFRKDNPDIFKEGEYVRLTPEGDKEAHLVAFARRLGDRATVVIAPRLFARLGGDADGLPTGPAVWDNTWLETPFEGAREYTNVLTGERVLAREMAGRPHLPVWEALANFPVALLYAD